MANRLIPLKYIINKYLQKKGFAKKVETFLVLEEFKKIAAEIWPEEVIKQMSPAYIKEGVLYVAVLNSVLGQEIKMRELLILSELKRRFGREVAREIRVII